MPRSPKKRSKRYRHVCENENRLARSLRPWASLAALIAVEVVKWMILG